MWFGASVPAERARAPSWRRRQYDDDDQTAWLACAVIKEYWTGSTRNYYMCFGLLALGKLPTLLDVGLARFGGWLQQRELDFSQFAMLASGVLFEGVLVYLPLFISSPTLYQHIREWHWILSLIACSIWPHYLFFLLHCIYSSSPCGVHLVCLFREVLVDSFFDSVAGLNNESKHHWPSSLAFAVPFRSQESAEVPVYSDVPTLWDLNFTFSLPSHCRSSPERRCGWFVRLSAFLARQSVLRRNSRQDCVFTCYQFKEWLTLRFVDIEENL